MKQLLLDEMAPISFALFLVALVASLSFGAGLLALFRAKSRRSRLVGLLLAIGLALSGVYLYQTYRLGEDYYVLVFFIPLLAGVVRLLPR